MAFPKGAFIVNNTTGAELIVKHGPDECVVYETGAPGYCVGQLTDQHPSGCAMVIPASEIEAEGAYRRTGFHWDRPVPKRPGL